MSLVERALAAHRAGRLDEAESGYRLALSHDPRNADALHLLGVAHLDRGALSEAEALIRQAIAINERAIFLTDLGNVLLDAQRFAEAEAVFQRAIERDPSNAVTYYNLGTLYADTQRPEQAEHAFRRALGCAADFVHAHINLGGLLLDRGRHAEAETSLRNALALDRAAPPCIAISASC